jgi:hypothetical protein
MRLSNWERRLAGNLPKHCASPLEVEHLPSEIRPRAYITANRAAIDDAMREPRVIEQPGVRARHATGCPDEKVRSSSDDAQITRRG